MYVNSRRRWYAMYLPENYDKSMTWPTIIFLHGAGERGADGWLPTKVGIAPAIQAHPERFPCIVVMPQCPRHARWVDKQTQPMLRDVWAAICTNYSIDFDRVYLTGLSMGGVGSWLWASRHPKRFAAVMPICGSPAARYAASLSKLPIWTFHGQRDLVRPVDETRAMVDALRFHGSQVRYTEWARGNHHIWDRVYQNPRAIRWLLRQKRSAAPLRDHGRKGTT